MNLKNLFPLLPVEKVETTNVKEEVNTMIQDGWKLLITYPVLDEYGSYHAVFVLGKFPPATDRTFTDFDFDQRHGG